tara:strand:+ start:269 stop:556 length:288 start_codon:yes stop_codon:yes gene_type:complete
LKFTLLLNVINTGKSTEDILDGICECKYPYTPKLRERITHNVGGGRRKAKVKKLSIDDKIDMEIDSASDEYIESLMKREEENMDGAHTFKEVLKR